MILNKQKLKITQIDLILFSFYIFSIIFLRFFYSQTLNLLDKTDIFYIDLARYSLSDFGIYFLDDSAKYELFLKDGTNLSFFHGGFGLQFLGIILKNFFSNNFIIFGVIFINFVMVIDNYLLFRKDTKIIIWFLLIPFLSYSTITFNKEIATITTLLSITLLSSDNTSINFKYLLLKPRFYLRFLAFVMTILSRPSLIIFTLSLYFIFNLLKSFKKLSIKINLKLFILLFSFSIIFIVIFVVNIESIQIFLNLLLSWYKSEKEVSFFKKLFGSFFIFFVPFPIGFLNINWLIKGSFDAKFMYFAYSFLCLLGIYRAYLVSCILKFFIVKKIKINIDAINMYVLLILGIAIGYSGDEITRQLITISIPLTIIIDKFRIRNLNKTNYNKSIY